MTFVEHYRDVYRQGDEQQRLWRATCAIEKAANVVSIWKAATAPARPMVVDIGCGDGAIAAELAANDFYQRLDGFDVSDSGVAIANDRRIPQATFAVYEGAAYPSTIRPTSSHSSVTSSSTWTSHGRVLREAARVACWLVVEVPLERNAKLRGEFRWIDTGHVNFYDPVLIRQLIQSCGLAVVAERVTNPGRAWAQATTNRKLPVKNRSAWYALHGRWQ
jgi:hypothetical protein